MVMFCNLLIIEFLLVRFDGKAIVCILSTQVKWVFDFVVEIDIGGGGG